MQPTNPTPPPPRGPDTTVILAVTGIVIALLIVITMLAIFAPTLTPTLAPLIIAVVIGTGIPSVLSLVKAGEAKEAATRTEGKTDAIQVSVDGRITALIDSLTAQGLADTTAARLQATLDEKAAQAGRDAVIAGQTNTERTVSETRTFSSPAAQPATYQTHDNYPDGPTPFGPPPSPGTEPH